MTIAAFVFFLAHIAGCCGITLRPAEDTIVADNSSDNVTYTCVASADGVTLLWEILGEQIWSDSQVDRYVENGVYIEREGKTLTLVVTPRGRQQLHAHMRPITIICTSYDARAFKIAESSQELEVIQFGPPGPVVGLELTYHSETELRLQWSIPDDSHPDVNITHVVNIFNTATATITLSSKTTKTYVVVSQRNEMCQPHIFSVAAINDAGIGPDTTIMESIPISPNIDEISDSQEVDQVLLTDDGNVNVTISFQRVETCNDGYPVLNYTVEIGGSHLVLNASDYSVDIIPVVISSREISALTRDQQYSVLIGACNEFTCRSSTTPLLVVTSDVQAVSVVFYMTSIMIDCTLTEGSTATGCQVVFTRYTDGGIENVTASAGICPELTQTRGAYEDEVVVYPVGPDRYTVSQPITVSVVDAVESDNFTCSIPQPTVMHSTSPKESGDGPLNNAGIAWIAAGVAVLVIIIAVVVGISTAVAIRHRNRTKTVSHEQEGTDCALLESQYVSIGRLVRGDGGRVEPDLNEGIADKVHEETEIFWRQ